MRKLIFIFVPSIIVLTIAFAQPTIEKPNILPTKILNKQEQKQVYDYLRQEGGIFVELTPAKNDYVDKNNRGTVFFKPEKGINILGREVYEAANYARHKVIIPDGTELFEQNFSQRHPHTECITGKNLTFIKCNLTNVELDPTWTLIDCNTSQCKRYNKAIGERTYEITECEKYGEPNVYEESSRFDITDIPAKFWD